MEAGSLTHCKGCGKCSSLRTPLTARLLLAVLQGPGSRVGGGGRPTLLLGSLWEGGPGIWTWKAQLSLRGFPLVPSGPIRPHPTSRHADCPVRTP